jgi:dimethylamine/trimethylamine dehydrogenase
MISYWTQFTLEQEKIQARLANMGVKFLIRHSLTKIEDTSVTARCAITGLETNIARDSVLLVTDRIPNDHLYKELLPARESGRLDSLRLIGDAEAPATIAQAVFAGHLAAREFDETIDLDKTPFAIERIDSLTHPTDHL